MGVIVNRFIEIEMLIVQLHRCVKKDERWCVAGGKKKIQDQIFI